MAAASFPIPEAALARHIAVLGETGAGKTYTTKKVVEHLAGEGYRVCVLDTVKSDWWGLTSSANGRKAGLPFTILGGPRGHVPLHGSSGAVIGELVGKGLLPLSIIDMADFRPGQPQAFFEDFAEALWKHMTGVLYLVIEEAHEIAPKERVGFSKENMAVYWAKKLATGGRSKGLRLIIASQRTQSVHNALLGSCGTMFALALSLPADQKPVKDWLDANVRDKVVRDRVKDELAFLPTGTAWVACAKENFFQRVQMPALETFDNSKTPDKDSSSVSVTMATVDRAGLRAMLGDAIAEAEANDPAKLRAEIARLTKALSSSGADKAVEKIDMAAVQTARAEGRSEGVRAGKAAVIAALKPLLAAMDKGLDVLSDAVRAINGIEPDAVAPAAHYAPTAKSGPKAAAHHGQSLPDAGARVSLPARPAVVEGAAGSTLSGPQLLALKALAFWATLGDAKPTRAKLCAVCGWKVSSGHIKNVLGSLKTAGLVTYPTAGSVELTAEGKAAAPAPDASTTVRQALTPVLTGPQALVVDLLLATPGSELDRDSICEQLGWERSSGHIKNVLGSLRTLEIITYPQSGWVQLESWVRQ